MKIGKADVRVYKKLTSNALLVKKPLLVDVVNGEPVRSERIIARSHWEQIGTGESLAVETVLKNVKGEVIPMAAARNILETYKNYPLNGKSEEVDKKQIHSFILNPDGSIGDEALPYSATERIEEMETPPEPGQEIEPGQAYWIPANSMDGFLIHEEYELAAADIKNDIKLFKEAEAANKRDEVLITTFSNGGYTL